MRNKCGMVGFCGLCYAGARGRAYHKGHTGYRPSPAVPHWRVDRDMQKPKPVPGGATSASLVPERGLVGEHTNLRDYLTNPKYDDGTPRELATITLFWEGQPKAALNDRDYKRSLYVSSDTWAGCLANLEDCLANNDGEWRAWGGGKKRK